MKVILAFLGALGSIVALILAIFKRYPRASVDPKIKKALEIREEINEQTNRTILKLQERRIEQLESEVNSLHDKLESLLWVREKINPSSGRTNP